MHAGDYDANYVNITSTYTILSLYIYGNTGNLPIRADALGVVLPKCSRQLGRGGVCDESHGITSLGCEPRSHLIPSSKRCTAEPAEPGRCIKGTEEPRQLSWSRDLCRLKVTPFPFECCRSTKHTQDCPKELAPNTT